MDLLLSPLSVFVFLVVFFLRPLSVIVLLLALCLHFPLRPINTVRIGAASAERCKEPQGGESPGPRSSGAGVCLRREEVREEIHPVDVTRDEGDVQPSTPSQPQVQVRRLQGREETLPGDVPTERVWPGESPPGGDDERSCQEQGPSRP